jgi:hypothetical protein
VPSGAGGTGRNFKKKFRPKTSNSKPRRPAITLVIVDWYFIGFVGLSYLLKS